MEPTTKLAAFDLDGTLTQHKTPIEPQNRAVLEALAQRYRLLMVGAGNAQRIFHQLGDFPIDVIGNYGMQQGAYNPESRSLRVEGVPPIPCDREDILARAAELRYRCGFTQYTGESVEFHASGVLTFALLGTRAAQADKLAFDPDRSKRRAVLDQVAAAFPEFNVFVGGSSSFDLAPKPYDKRYALERYCAAHGLSLAEAAFFGDDYGPGGNDECVYRSGVRFFPVDDYRRFGEIAAELLK